MAKLEGLDLFRIAGIFIDSDDPVSDDARFGPDEGTPGSSSDYPLPITVYDSLPADLNELDPHDPENEILEPHSPAVGTGGDIHCQNTTISLFARQMPIAPLQGDCVPVSPLSIPLPALPPTPEGPPSPAISLGSSPTQPIGLSAPPWQQQHSSPSTGSTSSISNYSHHYTQIPRWTVDEYGFAEPSMSLTEVGRVVSDAQPPGWLTGQIQMIGKGLFMGKLKKTNLLV